MWDSDKVLVRVVLVEFAADAITLETSAVFSMEKQSKDFSFVLLFVLWSEPFL